MNKRALGADVLLLITAALWGFGFVAQSSGMDYVGPFTYNALRFPLGSLSLLPLIIFLKAKNRLFSSPDAGHFEQIKKTLLAGTVLFIAVMFQQIGIIFTTVGNAGFITGFYVVLTPVFGIFIGKKTRLPTWAGMAFAFAGLYFIFAAGNLSSINPGDLIILISAAFWAVHILVIDHLVQKIDPLVLSAGQFAWCGVFSVAAAFVLEPFAGNWAVRITGDFSMQRWTPFPELLTLAGKGEFFSQPVSGAVLPILYGGLASVGIAYTLQVVAQKNAPPAHATIILCLEGCFAAVGGMLLRSEKPGLFTLLGFGFMLFAMFITQWDVIGRKKIE
ncbi:MAG: DMT family transporter [Treponema sp.]|jgi:drug/metabolite transporter (DMT)-like permease|nr:DMT family transporter [Treponema sp.]